MTLALANPYLSNLQGKSAPTVARNQYGGSTTGIANMTGTPNAGIGTTKVNPAPAPTPAPAAAPAPGNVSRPDPAAVAAAQAAATQRASLIQQIQAGQSSIQQGGASAIRDLSNSYATNNRNTVQQLQAGQQGINSSRENTALNLRRSMATILDGIREGFHSSKSALASKNATNSGSLADIARALAGQGGSQAGDARNEAFLANQGIDVQQQQLDQQRLNALADFSTYRNTEMDRISNSLFDQLRTLESNASAAGQGGQVDMGLRDQLINQAIAQLNAIDQQTSQTLSGVQQLTPDQINANAIRLDTGGAVGFQAPPSRLVV